MGLYDQKHIQDFYNEYGENETERWDKSIIEKVKYLVHNHYLYKYILPGDQVLELGAGTGMFTKELVGLAGSLMVTDLSPVQLDLNKKRAEEDNYKGKIEDFRIIDICDLSTFEDDQFDKVVCYGGPLSYVFERNADALSEIYRVLKPGGIALVSVMNLWGSFNRSMHSIMSEISKEDNEKVLTTGNLHPTAFTNSNHHCHIYKSEEFRTILESANFEILELSASNCLSVRRAAELEDMQHDKAKWEYFIDLEIRACKSPGLVESGTHIIAIIERTI
ncbi:MAG: class I SAM-dependent methyltransferase [Bacteroidota bacterium]